MKRFILNVYHDPSSWICSFSLGYVTYLHESSWSQEKRGAAASYERLRDRKLVQFSTLVFSLLKLQNQTS